MTELAGSTRSFAELPLDAAVEQVLSLGLNSVEISYRADAEPEEWERALALLNDGAARVCSVALEESVSAEELREQLGRAVSVGANVLVAGLPSVADPTNWDAAASEAVVTLLELTEQAAASEVTLAWEMPRRGTLAGDLDSYRAFSRLLVRHRVPLSVDSDQVAEAGLSVNELWRYFASRIAHIRFSSPLSNVLPDEEGGGEPRVDLRQWARMAFAYGYPGLWVLNPELDESAPEQRASILADYRQIAEDALAKYVQPAPAK